MTEHRDPKLAEFDAWNERLEAQHNRVMKHVRITIWVGGALSFLIVITCLTLTLMGRYDISAALGAVCLMIIIGSGVMISVSTEPAKRDGEKFLRALRAYRKSLRNS